MSKLFGEDSVLQLQADLEMSCSGLSEQDWHGSGQGFCGTADFERFSLVREINSTL